jgi:glycosyltransferase involved in cell wall biosynthesis
MKQAGLPLLSVVIPVKNNLAGLEKTLDALLGLNASEVRLELIVIDGGGCKKTERYLLNNQHRIQHIRSTQDAGIYHAMNYGKGCASGRWVWFCGAGDLPLESTWNAMMEQLSLWSSEALHIFSVDLGQNREAGVPSHYPGRWDSSLIWRNTTHHQGVVYPLSIIQKADFNPAYSVLADYAMHLHFWSSGVQAILHEETWSQIDAGGASRQFGLSLYWQEWKLKCQTIRGWRLAAQPFWLIIKFAFKKSGIRRGGQA